MRWAIAIAGLAGCGGAVAASSPAGETGGAGGSFVAVLTCTGSIEFGAACTGESASAPVECVNDSPGEIVVRPSIGGADAAMFTISPPGELRLAPGERAELSVAFHPRGDAPVRCEGTLDLRAGGPTVASIPLGGTVVFEHLTISAPELTDQFEYGPYDFGFVRPGLDAALQISITNACSLPFRIHDFSLDPSSDPAFLLFPGPPFTVPARTTVSAELRFAPWRVGQHDGQINVVSEDPANPVRSYKVAGFGGGPLLACDASELHLGDTAPGTPRTLTLACSNTSPWDDPDTERDRLDLEEAAIEGAAFAAAIDGGPRRDGYGVGEGFRVNVTFDPPGPGRFTGTLLLRSNDPYHPELAIPVDGTGL